MISWVAVEGILERQMRSDAKLRAQTAGRPMRADAEGLTDEELLAKLHSFGVELDRPALRRMCEQALSAERITGQLIKERTPESARPGMDSDWIWICLLTLWQRWFPDLPSFESLDDKIHAGYELLSSGGAAAACPCWLDAWTEVLRLLDETGIRTIREFDRQFRGTQSLFNWIQDLESELWNAGLDDSQFLLARVFFCEEALRRFPSGDALIIENQRRALAESCYELGAVDKAETFYREWLAADPGWGWGWIGWSDCYQFSRSLKNDLRRAEELLRQGFSIADVRDREDIADRLAELCQAQGRDAEAAELQKQARQSAAAVEVSRDISVAGNVLRQTTRLNFGDEGLPLEELPNVAAMMRGAASPASIPGQKIGRNEPCPCGSGKKYKKCCGS